MSFLPTHITTLRAHLALFLIEWRGILFYRIDFLLRVFIGFAVQAYLGFVVWNSVYGATHSEALQGYPREQMLRYCLVVALVTLSTRGPEIGHLSREIYEGGLTKFLVFPIHFISYKAMSFLAHASVGLIQIWVLMGVMLLWTPLSSSSPVITPLPLLLGSLSVLCGAVLYFLLCACLESIAFWVATTWSLVVLLQFITAFLGGMYIPLRFFPPELSSLLSYLPFAHIISFPTRILLGEASSSEVGFHFMLSGAWALFALLLLGYIWRRGLLAYTGVGQ